MLVRTITDQENYWSAKLSLCTSAAVLGPRSHPKSQPVNQNVNQSTKVNQKSFFSTDVNLIRAYYYTALPEDQEFSSLRPLIDWLDYNGFAVVSKLTREFTDPETGKRRIKGNMDMELALDMLKLAPHINHAILFSGDGDFCRLLEEVQGMGVRVSIVSTTKSSPPMIADSLRRMADIFIEMDTIRDQIGRPPKPIES